MLIIIHLLHNNFALSDFLSIFAPTKTKMYEIS